MSSLPNPFSVCESPCESCGVKRRCTSSFPHQQPSSRRLAAAAAGLGCLPAHQLSYSAKRNLAAAAVGGRKITHPGKAILAGLLQILIMHIYPFYTDALCTSRPHLNLSPVRAKLGQSMPAVMLRRLYDVAADTHFIYLVTADMHN